MLSYITYRTLPTKEDHMKDHLQGLLNVLTILFGALASLAIGLVLNDIVVAGILKDTRNQLSNESVTFLLQGATACFTGGIFCLLAADRLRK